MRLLTVSGFCGLESVSKNNFKDEFATKGKNVDKKDKNMQILLKCFVVYAIIQIT